MSLGLLKKFLQYGLIGGSTLLIELLLLYLLLEYTPVHYIVAVTSLFIFGTILNYVASRRFVFRGSERSLTGGYAYFLSIAVVGLLFTVILMFLLVDILHQPILISRIIAAAIVYLWNFSANQVLNFKLHHKKTNE